VKESAISKSSVRPQGVDALAAIVLASLDNDKAEEVVTIDLRGRSSFTECMVVATGRSTRQVGAMADHLLALLKDAGVSAAAEGISQGDWVLIDAGDLVVHLFRPEVREFYDLEGMWSEGGDREPAREPVRKWSRSGHPV